MEVAPAAVAFSDGSACELHFASSGEKRCVDERGAQTEDIGSRCNATQTWLPTTIETQTESDRYAKTDPEALLAFDEWNERPPGMDDFLLRAGEAMLDELEQSDASQAFIGYVPFQEGEDNGISCYLTLSCDLSALQRGKDDGEDQASGWKVTGACRGYVPALEEEKTRGLRTHRSQWTGFVVERTPPHTTLGRRFEIYLR